MVGRLTLNQLIVVRVHAPQPIVNAGSIAERKAERLNDVGGAHHGEMNPNALAGANSTTPIYVGKSFNGRNADSESANDGSSPSSPTKF